ncbi:linoleoyl phosphatidylcholine delta-12 acetylenase [Mycena olivaceomarginata]|nr:linoleoyl phosphatidylcholine delta-12 acetylenase [Mycena olivaceomarginata]
MGANNSSTLKSIFFSNPLKRMEYMKTENPNNHPNWTLQDLRRAIPPSIFKHRPAISLTVLARDIILAALLFLGVVCLRVVLTEVGLSMFMPIIWLFYWWFQGLVFTGLWVIGHECAHESFLPNKLACNVLGLICHSFLWTPYFSWKTTHRIHHRYHGHMVRDQHWIPPTRSEVQVERHSFRDYFEDTPLVVLVKLIVQQTIGFQSYLLFNISGPRHFPLSTSHFNPYSIMFKSTDRAIVLISDVAIFFMGWITTRAVGIWGLSDVFMVYCIPCLLVSHWVTMVTFLHHTDPMVPRYRDGGWSYTRGAVATVDRDFLGWQGRFFLHDIAHFHIVHHLFPQIPFYNVGVATQHVKELIGRDYHATSEPVFISLWTNYMSCQFVEDEGDVVFHKTFEKNTLNTRLQY